jgi:hypothetical protein
MNESQDSHLLIVSEDIVSIEVNDPAGLHLQESGRQEVQSVD